MATAASATRQQVGIDAGDFAAHDEHERGRQTAARRGWRWRRRLSPAPRASTRPSAARPPDHAIAVMAPRHMLLGAQRGLGELALSGRGGDAAQVEMVQPGAVRAAEDRPHVEDAAHVVEQPGDGGKRGGRRCGVWSATASAGGASRCTTCVRPPHQGQRSPGSCSAATGKRSDTTPPCIRGFRSWRSSHGRISPRTTASCSMASTCAQSVAEPSSIG
jgi:hypothetical protein